MSDKNTLHHSPYTKPGHKGFLKGNAGRPVGATRRISRDALALVHANAVNVTTVIIQKALLGEACACSLCASLIFPRQRPVEVDLTDTDHVVEQALNGELSAEECKSIIGAVSAQREATEIDELRTRLAQLERMLHQ